MKQYAHGYVCNERGGITRNVLLKRWSSELPLNLRECRIREE